MPQHPGPGPRTVHVGKNVKRARERRGLTQQQLADQMSDTWSQQIIAKLELGITGMRVEQLLDLAAALDVKPGDLLRGAMDVTEAVA